MEKIDLTKQYKSYYTATSKPELVTIERVHFLSVTGKGDPSGQEFSEKIRALYSTAYTLKFMFKAKQQDFTVAKLEGLWWFDERQYSGISMEEAPKKVPRKEWLYRLLIRLPDFVTEKDIAPAAEAAYSKKQFPLIKEVTWFEMAEGKCVQMLHIGPFDKEPETLLQISAFTQANNLQKNGVHHEIYLSDFNKTSPERLKTILREPVKEL